MTHASDECPNCRTTHEEAFQGAKSELKDFFAIADALPLSIKARLYEHVHTDLFILHDLMKECETPEQQSLGLSLHYGLERWGPDDLYFFVNANTYVELGSLKCDADLLVTALSNRSGYDKPVLRVLIQCDREEGEGLDAQSIDLDRECIASGIFPLHFTKAEALNQPGRCEHFVERAIEAVLTTANRAGWVAPGA